MTARSTADLPALDIAYRAGIVSSGKNLAKVAIIDWRGYDEQGIHYIWRSFSERARLPLTENILKCQLKPLAFADYPGITFSAGQQARLNAVFPNGVCDWTRPGVGQQDPVSPLTYTAGPGGAALPAAPTSTPI